MPVYSEQLKRNLEESIRIKELLLREGEQMKIFDRAVALVATAYRRGGRLYIAGNGGSAADAQHLAAEFVSRLTRARQPLPAEALTVDTSTLTAIANDFGYEEVFARQIEAKMKKGDVFLGITTSGVSPNILRAFEQCRKMDLPTILFGGRNGGPAKNLASLSVIVPSDNTSTIQEVHIVLYHTLCGCVEAELFSEGAC